MQNASYYNSLTRHIVIGSAASGTVSESPEKRKQENNRPSLRKDVSEKVHPFLLLNFEIYTNSLVFQRNKKIWKKKDSVFCADNTKNIIKNAYIFD